MTIQILNKKFKGSQLKKNYMLEKIKICMLVSLIFTSHFFLFVKYLIFLKVLKKNFKTNFSHMRKIFNILQKETNGF